MRRRQSNLFAILAILAVGVAACGGGGDAADQPEDTQRPAAGADTGAAVAPGAGQAPANVPEGATQEQVAQGQELFRGAGGCQACHGPDATGTQLAPNLTDDEWINIEDPNVDKVIGLIRTGVAEPREHPTPMPPMGGANLTDEQVRALAAYVMSIAQG